MNRLLAISAALLLLCIGIALPASAESLKEKVAGVWTLQSGSENFPDGKKLTPWEAGHLTLDLAGHISQFLLGKDRPKTSADPRAPIGPAVGFYGTYTLDEGKETITYKIEHALNPPLEGTVRVFKVTFSGELMTLTAPETETPQGKMTPVNVWRRTE